MDMKKLLVVLLWPFLLAAAQEQNIVYGTGQRYSVPSDNDESLAHYKAVSEKYAETLFSRTFLRDPLKVRSFLADPEKLGEPSPEVLSFDVDGVPVSATYFNRNSSTLVLVVGGFAVHREALMGISKFLDTYDLLFCDFPGHGPDRRKTNTWKAWFTEKIAATVAAGFNIDDMTYAERESECIERAVGIVKARKVYTKVIGVGFCYGGYFLVKLNSDKKRKGEPCFFDGLWLDGLWLSIENVAQHYLYFQVVRLADTALMKWLADGWLAQTISSGLTRLVVGKHLTAFPPVTDYFDGLEGCDVMLVKARRDVLVPDDSFARILDYARRHNSSALVWESEAYHARVHINYRELYALLANAFIEGGVSAVTKKLQEVF